MGRLVRSRRANLQENFRRSIRGYRPWGCPVWKTPAMRLKAKGPPCSLGGIWVFSPWGSFFFVCVASSLGYANQGRGKTAPGLTLNACLESKFQRAYALALFQPHDRNDRRDVERDEQCNRPPRARSRLARRLESPADRTWSRAGCFRGSNAGHGAGWRSDRPAGDRAKAGASWRRSARCSHFETAAILFTSAFFGSVRIFFRRGLVKTPPRSRPRQAADELRIQAVLKKVLRLDVTGRFAGAAVFRRQYWPQSLNRGRTARGRGSPRPRRRRADEQDVAWCRTAESCCGCLRPP